MDLLKRMKELSGGALDDNDILKIKTLIQEELFSLNVFQKLSDIQEDIDTLLEAGELTNDVLKDFNDVRKKQNTQIERLDSVTKKLEKVQEKQLELDILQEKDLKEFRNLREVIISNQKKTALTSDQIQVLQKQFKSLSKPKRLKRSQVTSLSKILKGLSKSEQKSFLKEANVDKDQINELIELINK